MSNLSRREALKLAACSLLLKQLPGPQVTARVVEVVEKTWIGVEEPVVFDLQSLPIPIVHSDFCFSSRMVI